MKMGYQSEVGDRRESFINVRVRMQRLSDAKFFAGWVRTLSDSEIVIDFPNQEEFQLGEKFFVTINGVHSAAVVQATLENQSIGYLTLKYDNTLKYLNTTESVRRLVTGLSGTIHIDGVEIEMQISDVSANGFGAVVDGTLARGTITNIEIDTPFGNITGKAEIRYCRQDTKDSLKHRIGLQFVHLGRIETARWSRLTEDGSS
jgi:PilZ domain